MTFSNRRPPSLVPPLYGALTTGLLLPLLPLLGVYGRLGRRLGGSFRERMGFYPPLLRARSWPSPRIWLHAASLGEVRVASALLRALAETLPPHTAILSVMTPHGRRLAEELVAPEIPVLFAPVDLFPAVHLALRWLRPQVLAFVETEIWPNWILEAHRLGIMPVLLNGRVSARSARRYRRFRPLFRHVLDCFEAFSVCRTEDAERLADMGAARAKIQVHGNAKYDLLLEGVDPGQAQRMRRDLGLEPGAPVLVAGSTRRGEEALILEAFERVSSAVPGAVLVLAPRHIARAPEVEELARRRGWRCRRRTAPPERPGAPVPQVIVLDTFGELLQTYGLATVVFCGGSLVPLGGQNPLEAAAWAKPVLFGPHMDNFPDACELLERAGGGFLVTDPAALAMQVTRLFIERQAREQAGDRARRALAGLERAAPRHARVISRLLDKGRGA